MRHRYLPRLGRCHLVVTGWRTDRGDESGIYDQSIRMLI